MEQQGSFLARVAIIPEADQHLQGKFGIYIPHPIPECIECGLSECTSGSYKSKTKVLNLVGHFKKKHDTDVTPYFCCQFCDNESPSIVVAKQHEKQCKNNTGDLGVEDKVEIEKGPGEFHHLTLPFPLRPTQCPLCNWVTFATKGAGELSTSLSHHLGRQHRIQSKWKWRCNECKTIITNYHLSSHKCPEVSQSSVFRDPNVTDRFTPDLDRRRILPRSLAVSLIARLAATSPANHSLNQSAESPSSTSASSAHVVSLSSSEEETIDSDVSNETGEGTVDDVAQYSPSDGSGLSVGSDWESLSSSIDIPLLVGAVGGTSEEVSEEPGRDSQINSVHSPARGSSSGESEFASPRGSQLLELDDLDAEEEATNTQQAEPETPSLNPKAKAFGEKWKPRLLACHDMAALESTLDELADDWHSTSATKPSTQQSCPPRPTNQAPPQRKERHQNRQQQRAKQKSKKGPKEASKIQKKFILRPRQAVREVLGETSQPYTGTIEDAKIHLDGVFQRPVPSEEEVQASRKLFDECQWAIPSGEQTTMLSGPPTKADIAKKLHRATNTSPGMDKIEYRHIKSLDPTGDLLATLFAAVWRIGIPRQWKTDKTVLIYKKGDSSKLVNFRPIALLSTLYKLFSSVLTSRLTMVSTVNGWISPEQKGFLPGVRGIQEHTHLLQSAIEEAKKNKSNLTICWLDLSNAFGSLPHATLSELFSSLPIPEDLRKILKDIYSGTSSQFLIGEEIINILMTAGVRQGDALSTIVFDLAIEPLLRAAKSISNTGFKLLGMILKATAYADDFAVVAECFRILQIVLNAVVVVAAILGINFNVPKCSYLAIEGGKAATNRSVTLYDIPLRAIKEDEHETYLGIPIGCRLTFRLQSNLKELLGKLADSLLAPWQKLEVFRAYLLPSLSHQLSSGRVEKGQTFEDLEAVCRSFLRHVTNTTLNANTSFLYADRRVGGLGATQLSDEANIWTIARAIQLLDSSDPVVKGVSREQLRRNVITALRLPPNCEEVPTSAYLSGSQTDGLAMLKHSSGKQDFWSRARRNAEWFRGLQIDISSNSNPSILVADEVSVVSAKAVRGLRTVIRQRWTNIFLCHPQQGRVAQGLALDTKSKDIAWMTSWRTGLTFQDWHQIHRSRLSLLPVRARPGSQLGNKKCRHCNQYDETTAHVICGCQNSMVLATERHNAVQNLLVGLLGKYGHSVDVNKQFAGSGLKPDIVIISAEQPILIDVTVTWDDPLSLQRAKLDKISKYQHLGQILPLVVGALGSWPPETDELRQTLQLHPRDWNRFRRRARLAAIQGSTKIIHHHLSYGETTQPEENEEEEDEELLQ